MLPDRSRGQSWLCVMGKWLLRLPLLEGTVSSPPSPSSFLLGEAKVDLHGDPVFKRPSQSCLWLMGG